MSTSISELHVFDFDGTLFRSPAPHPRNNTEKEPTYVDDTIIATLFNGGFGWFQDKESLNPPLVPESPSTDTSNDETCFYVPSMLNHFHQVRSNNKNAFVVVMTGREQYFTSRVTGLLKNAGLETDKTYLKDHPKSGTTNYKMATVARLLSEPAESNGAIQTGAIKKVVMYEDRVHHAESFKQALGLMSDMAKGASLGQVTYFEGDERASSSSSSSKLQPAPRWASSFNQNNFLARTGGNLGGSFEFEIIMPLEGERKETHVPADIEQQYLAELAVKRKAWEEKEALKPKCKCGVKAFEGIVRKEGPNKGRDFFGCKSRNCDFFMWADAPPRQAGRGVGGRGGGGRGGGGRGRGGGYYPHQASSSAPYQGRGGGRGGFHGEHQRQKGNRDDTGRGGGGGGGSANFQLYDLPQA